MKSASWAVRCFALPWASAFLTDVAGRVVVHDLLEVAAPAPLFREGGSVLALAGFWLAVPFVFFSLMTVIQFFVVLFFYPETKGITLEDMQKKLKISAATG